MPIPDLGQGLTAIGAAVPLTAIAKRMLGPAADEIAQLMADQVRFWRYRNQLRFFDKAAGKSKKAKFTVTSVAPKILFPLLEGASYEDDEDVQELWAGLLATAASVERAAHARPAFIGLLRQMSPEEALVLNWMIDHPNTSSEPVTLRMLHETFLSDTARDIRPGLFRSGLEDLAANQLISMSNLARSVHDSYIGSIDATLMKEPYRLTHRGAEFIAACRPEIKWGRISNIQVGQNLQGRIVTILDLGLRLGFSKAVTTQETCDYPRTP